MKLISINLHCAQIRMHLELGERSTQMIYVVVWRFFLYQQHCGSKRSCCVNDEYNVK